MKAPDPENIDGDDKKDPVSDDDIQFETLCLEIISVQLRQNISREMHKLYGFDCFKIDFDLDPENHDVTIIKIKTPS